jgi:hypothetical protein
MKKQNIYIRGRAELLTSVRPKCKHNKVITLYRCIRVFNRRIYNLAEG